MTVLSKTCLNESQAYSITTMTQTFDFSIIKHSVVNDNCITVHYMPKHINLSSPSVSESHNVYTNRFQ